MGLPTAIKAYFYGVVSNKYTFLSLLASGFLLGACLEQNDGKKGTEALPPPPPSETAIKDQFVKANQQLLQKENDEMDVYEKSHKLRFTRTPSGVRYYVYRHSEKGDSIRPGMQVSMNFVVKLLDGTECYNSRFEGVKTFVVAQEEAESGIHKGVQYLKKGDKALLLIPSPLAHGVLGDFKKIPPQMPIVYDLHVF